MNQDTTRVGDLDLLQAGGDLLERLGRHGEARAAFEAAARITGNTREQEMLKRRAVKAAKAAEDDRRS